MRRTPFLLTLLLLASPLHAQPPAIDLKWDRMDLGPYQAGTYKVRDQITAKGVAIKAGSAELPATVLFDTELLRWSAAWTGGFITFPRARGGVEGQIVPAGEVVLSTEYAPGWSVSGTPGEDPRENHRGHLPAEVAKWRGLYLHQGRTIFSYTVGKTEVLEMPSYQIRDGYPAFVRTVTVGPSQTSLTMLVCDAPAEAAPAAAPNAAEPAAAAPPDTAQATRPPRHNIRLHGPDAGKGKLRSAGARTVLEIPARPAPATIEIVFAALSPVPRSVKPDDSAIPDLRTMTKGGPPRWTEILETKGTLGTAEDAYVSDEIALPEENPYGSWFRPSGHDFLPDGSAVLASLSGDVWLVSGLDEKLERVRWKRFATGLFQPLGVRVVGTEIFVLGRDQLTRLRDLNRDGEADFYECFNNDCVVTENYHEFALDLQTDAAGNFLFAKGSPWQPNVVTPHQGCLLRISKDGSKLDVVATGLRAPNGVGVGPKGEITVSDNQGHWMPANRLNLIRPGGFYGMLPAAHRVLTFRTAAGEFRANPSSPDDQTARNEKFWGSAQTPRPEEGCDLPLCWIPMAIDNSSGGEVWVPEGLRWGPLAGRLLQLSYGKCTLFQVLQETVDGIPQAGLVKFPMKFSSGVMRGRFHPKDGQLYLSGLRVWQTDGAKDGCFARVRYTRKPLTLPVALRTTATGAEIAFAQELDRALAGDPDNYNVEAWNYLWSGAYGSPDFSVREPERRGRDQLAIEKATLAPDKKTVALTIADWQPAMQVRFKYQLATASGQPLDQEIYSTIHRVPKK